MRISFLPIPGSSTTSLCASSAGERVRKVISAPLSAQLDIVQGGGTFLGHSDT